MSSGTISGTTSSGSVLSRIRWTCEIDIATNTSVVTAQLAYQTTSNWHSGTFEGYLWIDGTRFECQKAITLQPNGSWVAVGTFSKTIQHNADGTKSIEIYATGGISGTAFNSTTCSAIVTLETIPRTTMPTTSGTFNVGSSVTINLPRAADSFTHTVQFSLNATDWTTIATGVATSTAWTLPASLATALPNATSGTVYIRAITYSGGTEIGSETISRTYYITSAYAAPSASIAVSQNNSANIGQYIRGKSTVTLTASASSLKYGATAVRYVFSYGGNVQTVISSATSASVSFALPSDAAEYYAYSVTLTDSRGYTATASGTIDKTVAYSAPAITSLTATRGDYDGSTFTANDTGKSLKIVASGTISSLLANANAKKYALDYRLQTATAYTALVSTTTASSYSFSLTYYTSAIFSEYSAYTIKLTLSDSFASTVLTVNVSSKQVMFNFNADGTAMGIGAIAGKANTINAGWPIDISSVGSPSIDARGAAHDMNAIIDSGVFGWHRFNVNTLNTAYKEGLTANTIGYVLNIPSGATSGARWGCQLALHNGNPHLYYRSMNGGTLGAWRIIRTNAGLKYKALWSGTASEGATVTLSESCWDYKFLAVEFGGGGNLESAIQLATVRNGSTPEVFHSVAGGASGFDIRTALIMFSADGLTASDFRTYMWSITSAGAHTASRLTVSKIYGIYVG